MRWTPLSSRCLVIVCLWASPVHAQRSAPPTPPLFLFDSNSISRWSSPENPNGAPGAGAQLNRGAKGHAFDPIEPGASRVLLDVKGAGIVSRIWITIGNRSPAMLRSLKLEMFWDGATTPAVSVPFGDFFGDALGQTSVFENALFANPEGRSFISYIPMPFRTGAKIVVTNESGTRLRQIYFDVDFRLLKQWNADNLYFHAYWHRDTATTIGRDFDLLPHVTGRGRYLGVNVGINSNPIYGDSWWGEGEVKMFMDGDNASPSIVGTGTEDYIGTGWGQSRFITTYAGCLVADEKEQQWTFYRLHIPDPIFFHHDMRVTLQQIGGNDRPKVVALQQAGVKLTPVTMEAREKFYRFLGADSAVKLTDAGLPDGWVNFYRSDDVSATAYFYLDKPASSLPPLQPVAERIYRLKSK